MPIKSFSDSSAVSVAYALGDGATAADFAAVNFNLLPFTTEGFQMQKDPKMSTAITNDRRPQGSKNTKGSAKGAVTVEFGATPFVRDLLSLALMNDWNPVDSADATKGTFLLDGDIKKFMAVEKTTKGGPLATDKLFHERYYGTAVNDMSLEFKDGDLITMALNTISTFADFNSAAAGANGLGGSIAKAKVVPAAYEIADSSNNLKKIVLKDASGVPMEATFADASLKIENNVREQSALGSEFAAGVGIGKVGASLEGEIYFFDQTILAAHMQSKRMSAELTLETVEGIFTLTLPRLVAQSPTNNATGENEDYKTKLTLTAESGEVTINAKKYTCLIAITFKPKV
jgi:hypothetical protein